MPVVEGHALLSIFVHIVVHCSLLSHAQFSETPWTGQLLYPPLSPEVCSNSCPLSWWCDPTILSSVTHFLSCLQFFPASGSFLVNRLFAYGGQSIGVSASASVLPVNIQGLFPLGLTGLILLSKGLSRVLLTLESTTIWKHQFFGPQPSLWSNSHIHIWLLEKP